MCTPEAETMLGEMAPEEVHKVAEAEKLDPGLVLKMAYPLYQEGLKWPDVKPCLTGWKRPACSKLAEIQALKTPMIFDSEDGHPPFGVVVGERAYESHFSTWLYHTLRKGGDPWANPSRMNEYECVAGC
mmetsp:Transcript_11628/g.23572  ORF Transcript_11628/g.23572 Transcript_11628/m.23572 type:complete len:129 (+) Transcript_11628:1-387(+)